MFKICFKSLYLSHKNSLWKKPSPQHHPNAHYGPHFEPKNQTVALFHFENLAASFDLLLSSVFLFSIGKMRWFRHIRQFYKTKNNNCLGTYLDFRLESGDL